MQVNPLLTWDRFEAGPTTGRLASRVGAAPAESWLAGGLALPLLQLLDTPPDKRAAREELSEEEREKRLRRRDAEVRDQAQAAATAPRPSDVIVKGERDMLPGSRAARQEELNSHAQEQANESRQGFRQALADAAARSKADQPQAAPREAAGCAPGGSAKSNSAPQSSVAPAADRAGNADAASVTDNAVRPAAATAVNAPSARLQVVQSSASYLPVTMPAAETPGGAAAASKLGALAAKASVAGARAVSAATGQTTGNTGNAAARLASGPPSVAPVARAGSVAGGKAPPAGATPEPAPEGSSDANMARIMRLVLARVGKDRSVATLRLDPPELGSVRLRLDLRNDQLSLQIDAQTPAARRLLSDQLDVLRRSLEAAGIQLDHVEVRVPAAPEVVRSSTSHLPGNPDTPPQPDVWAHNQDGRGQQEAGSAGGGPAQGTDAPPMAPAEPVLREVMPEPAAESLVNILA